MVIILSPAKSMDMSEPSNKGIPSYIPLFNKDAETIAAQMQRFSVNELEKLLKVSRDLAELNYERYQKFDLPETPSKQAIFAYSGSVFQSIHPDNLNPDQLSFAQSHLRIISTLYGLLRPLDCIKAYRMTFGIKTEGNDMYHFWKAKLTKALSDDLANDDNVLVNLASKDVSGALDMVQIEQRTFLVNPIFLDENKDGNIEVIRTYAKIARGAMTRYILLNKLVKKEDIKNFSSIGYRFDARRSSEHDYVFVRCRKDR
ncbi:MAG: YaaA family protein [Bacteroidales bacterium]|nr:YaaA family protein [Bacteroidales bacterium]